MLDREEKTAPQAAAPILFLAIVVWLVVLGRHLPSPFSVESLWTVIVRQFGLVLGCIGGLLAGILLVLFLASGARDSVRRYSPVIGFAVLMAFVLAWWRGMTKEWLVFAIIAATSLVGLLAASVSHRVRDVGSYADRLPQAFARTPTEWINFIAATLLGVVLVFRHEPAMLQVAATVMLAYAAAVAPRLLAAYQLGPKLLERFNGQDMFQARDEAWQEMMFWFSGDRGIFEHFVATETFLAGSDGDYVLGTSQQYKIGSSQLFAFSRELHVYRNHGLLDDADLQKLFRDRFSWFVKFMSELATELEARHAALPPQRRFPLRYLEIVAWLSQTLGLAEFVNARCDTADKEEQWMLRPAITVARRIDGFDPFNMRLDNDEIVIAIERQGDPAKGFNRLRCTTLPRWPIERIFYLDQGIASPFGWTRRLVTLSPAQAQTMYWRFKRQLSETDGSSVISHHFEPSTWLGDPFARSQLVSPSSFPGR